MDVQKSRGATWRISGTPSHRFTMQARLPCTESSVFEFPASAWSARDWRGPALSALSFGTVPLFFLFWQGEAETVSVCYPSDTSGLKQPVVSAFTFFPLVLYLFLFVFCIPGTQTSGTRNRNYVNVAHEEIMCDRNAWDWPVGEWQKGQVAVGGLQRAEEGLHLNVCSP